jgi:flagellar FliL protein
MAAAAAPANDQPAPAQGASLVVQLGLLVVLTLLAAGIGWFAGGALGPAPDHPATAGHGAKKGETDENAVAERPDLYNIEGIVTNLAAPNDVWIRLDLALIFNGPPEAAVADEIHQDLLAYLRTVKLHQIDGPSGFQHLRSDLEERASIRSGGKVSKILIRTLLFE